MQLDTSETRHDFSGNNAVRCDCSGLALRAELSRAPPDEFHQSRGALGGFRLTQVLLAFRASTIASC